MKKLILTLSALCFSSASVPSPILSLFDEREVNCLARNIYHESRGEPTKGQLAVALVTLNRVYNKKFPNTVCKVVYQKSQFSWTAYNYKIHNIKAWNHSKDLAYKVLSGSTEIQNFKALYFHTHQVSPGWNKKLKTVAKIGNHVFYTYKHSTN